MATLALLLAALAPALAPPDDDKSVGALVYLPGGKLVAGGGRHDADGWPVGVLAVHDARTGRRERRLAAPGQEVVALAASPDGSRLVAVGWFGPVRMWDLRGGGPPVDVQAGDDDAIVAVAFAPDGRTFATGGWGGVVRIRDASTGRLVRSLEADKEGVRGLVFLRGGTRLVAGGPSGKVRVWVVSGDRPASVIEAGQGGTCALALSPDGRTLASGGEDGTVKLWEAESGRALRTLRLPGAGERARMPGGDDPADGVAFSPDGSALAVSHRLGAVQLWDVKGGRPRPVQSRVAASTAVFSPDGGALAVGTSEGIEFWDWRRGVERPKDEEK